MNALAEILSSRARAEVFRLLFFDAVTELHLREIARRSGLTLGTVQQELTLTIPKAASRQTGGSESLTTPLSSSARFSCMPKAIVPLTAFTTTGRSRRCQ